MSFWSSKRVVVTGGAGFVGSFVVEKLQARGCKEVFVPRSLDYDLVENEAVKRLSTGKGNALSIGERIRSFGVKTKRPMPSMRQ